MNDVLPRDGFSIDDLSHQTVARVLTVDGARGITQDWRDRLGQWHSLGLQQAWGES